MHSTSLLKGSVRNSDFSDKDLVNIISKPYLLATRLSFWDIPFSYGRNQDRKSRPRLNDLSEVSKI